MAVDVGPVIERSMWVRAWNGLCQPAHLTSRLIYFRDEETFCAGQRRPSNISGLVYRPRSPSVSATYQSNRGRAVTSYVTLVSVLTTAEYKARPAFSTENAKKTVKSFDSQQWSARLRQSWAHLSERIPIHEEEERWSLATTTWPRWLSCSACWRSSCTS